MNNWLSIGIAALLLVLIIQMFIVNTHMMNIETAVTKMEQRTKILDILPSGQ